MLGSRIQTGCGMQSMQAFEPAIRSALGLFLACSVSHSAHAESWKPTRPVALVVGATPGGSLDLTARLIQHICVKHKLGATPLVCLNYPVVGQGSVIVL